MIKNRDIIVVGLQSWDIEIGSNCKNIALEFAKDNRVLYVNPPLDSRTRKRDRKNLAVSRWLEQKKKNEKLLSIGRNLWNLYPQRTILSLNWLPFTWLLQLFNRRNNARFARDIMEAARELSFTDFILFNDSDMLRSYYLQELLRPEVSIYYSRDNLMAVPYWYKHGHVLEPRLMRKSTLVCANSLYLADVARKYNPHSFYVGQGCDLSLFDPNGILAIPADIADIPRPRIGYAGAIISLRLDVKLLLELAKAQPGWSFVFIGKPDETFQRSGLKDFPNVHFLGMKEGGLLPGYMAQFDVAINPQQVNAVTIGNYPRKIDEYLAMGKPVVATSTVTMEAFSAQVYLAGTAAEFVEMIGRALRENNEVRAAERTWYARTHSWDNSVGAIYDAILAVHPAVAGLNQEI